MCREQLQTENALCGECWRDMPFNVECACVRCGAPLIGQIEAECAECDDCMKDPPLWRAGRSVFHYQGLARKLILELKHGDRPELGAPAAAWMAQVGADLLSTETAIIPISVHWQRRLRRKYNQAEILAHHVAEITSTQLISNALVRPRKTIPLKNVSRQERLAILENAFAIERDQVQHLKDRRVVLIDDVMTSGATLRAATRTLLDVGVQDISILVLARVIENT